RGRPVASGVPRLTRPRSAWNPVYHLIEAQVLARPQLHDVEDLAGVHGEVLHHVVDRFHGGDRPALHAHRLEQGRRVEGSDHRGGVLHRPGQAREELLQGEWLALVELLLPAPHVGRAAHSADDPLPNVSRQVEEEVPDAVRRFVRAPPELLLGEPFGGGARPGQELVQEEGPGVVEKCPGDVAHGKQLKKVAERDRGQTSPRWRAMISPPTSTETGPSTLTATWYQVGCTGDGAENIAGRLTSRRTNA